MGELMLRNLQVNPRFAEVYWPGTHWFPAWTTYLIATLVTATGADRAVRLVAQVADPQSLAAVARRFVEVEVLTFSFEGGTVYVTITDIIALARPRSW